jgi:hypothetical protein
LVGRWLRRIVGIARVHKDQTLRPILAADPPGLLRRRLPATRCPRRPTATTRTSRIARRCQVAIAVQIRLNETPLPRSIARIHAGCHQPSLANKPPLIRIIQNLVRQIDPGSAAVKAERIQVAALKRQHRQALVALKLPALSLRYLLRHTQGRPAAATHLGQFLHHWLKQPGPAPRPRRLRHTPAAWLGRGATLRRHRRGQGTWRYLIRDAGLSDRNAGRGVSRSLPWLGCALPTKRPLQASADCLVNGAVSETALKFLHLTTTAVKANGGFVFADEI